jgi:hypothetical protein
MVITLETVFEDPVLRIRDVFSRIRPTIAPSRIRIPDPGSLISGVKKHRILDPESCCI